MSWPWKREKPNAVPTVPAPHAVTLGEMRELLGRPIPKPTDPVPFFVRSDGEIIGVPTLEQSHLLRHFADPQGNILLPDCLGVDAAGELVRRAA